MKKTQFALLSLIIILLAACGSSSKSEKNSESNNNSSKNNSNVLDKTSEETLFSLKSYKLEKTDGIEIEEDYLFDIENSDLKIYSYDMNLFLIDKNNNVYFLNEDYLIADEYKTSYEFETRKINGKNILFIKWNFSDLRNGYSDGFEEDYSGIQIVDTDDFICLGDFIYSYYYSYYEASDDSDGDARMQDDTFYSDKYYKYDFNTTNTGFELTNYVVEVSSTDDVLYEDWSNSEMLPEGKYELNNNIITCSTKIPYDGARNGVFANASLRKLSDSDVEKANKLQLRLMRNEIYARHGYTFKSEDLKNYFGNCDWYKGTKTNVDAELTEIENSNIKLIQKYEK